MRARIAPEEVAEMEKLNPKPPAQVEAAGEEEEFPSGGEAAPTGGKKAPPTGGHQH